MVLRVTIVTGRMYRTCLVKQDVSEMKTALAIQRVKGKRMPLELLAWVGLEGLHLRYDKRISHQSCCPRRWPGNSNVVPYEYSRMEIS